MGRNSTYPRQKKKCDILYAQIGAIQSERNLQPHDKKNKIPPQEFQPEAIDYLPLAEKKQEQEEAKEKAAKAERRAATFDIEESKSESESGVNQVKSKLWLFGIVLCLFVVFGIFLCLLGR